MEFLNHFRNGLVEGEDRDCFEKFLSPHVSMLYKSAIRMCGNPNDAQDLVQETLFCALKSFHQINDPEKSKYWMFSILRNLFLKDIEKTKKRAEIEFDSVCDKLTDRKHPEGDFLRAEVKSNLQEVLGKLDERLKIALVQFYFEGLSYKEISESLNIPIGTVMSRIARAKVYLKRELLRSESMRLEISKYIGDEE
ncbi:MAG: sigma-70 family RNA polymerase sigma factor [Nitrospina sp.]|jgi:RNA polymerase sigma-70 factor (ECF subfamily)|nr:sigma-70 family RNA polymerase sigma factor [Nitrospina sp.]MBT3510158.1 sigma-70 family RNA polymerase sigma factor [Nitrospina sp.]MBT4047392.1 sigma-70 family RNA polymerase sigma factor [Nitrospina sp.]MBT4556732.1 sigma-70 family RNA polymerase sigma factor [Nitrospina sp.]MBT5349593.1 sigma-70 family RNA polymerase sigma factor [Nitrospina sp.]